MPEKRKKGKMMADGMLYSEEDKKQMKASFLALNKSRLRELVNYARQMEYSRIGIASCFSMYKYALLLKEKLEQEGFMVFLSHCKESGLKNNDIMEGCGTGPSCDPAHQAEYLNGAQTDLNINFGLCLGHGLIFSAKSRAPVTTFVVKDFAAEHNPLRELLPEND